MNCNARRLTVSARYGGADFGMSLKGDNLCTIETEPIRELRGVRLSSDFGSGKAAL
jgi:hypothetical protein